MSKHVCIWIYFTNDKRDLKLNFYITKLPFLNIPLGNQYNRPGQFIFGIVVPKSGRCRFQSIITLWLNMNQRWKRKIWPLIHCLHWAREIQYYSSIFFLLAIRLPTFSEFLNYVFQYLIRNILWISLYSLENMYYQHFRCFILTTIYRYSIYVLCFFL